MDRDVSLEEAVRPRIPLRRPAVHAPALSHVDRFPRYPGRVHARPRDRLLREQPPRDLRQQQYAIRNPKGLRDYGEYAWGITASNGPGPATRRVRGVTRRFLGYAARGVPYGPDDGTLAPWAVAASLPFAPEIVLPTLQHCAARYPKMENEYGLVCSINPTFPSRGGSGWISKSHFALDQGPVVLMIENYRSGLIWRLIRNCQYVGDGPAPRRVQADQDAPFVTTSVGSMTSLSPVSRQREPAARRDVAESDQVHVPAAAVFRDLQQLSDALEARLTRQC